MDTITIPTMGGIIFLLGALNGLTGLIMGVFNIIKGETNYTRAIYHIVVAILLMMPYEINM
jgi:hypothetical protein